MNASAKQATKPGTRRRLGYRWPVQAALAACLMATLVPAQAGTDGSKLLRASAAKGAPAQSNRVGMTGPLVDLSVRNWQWFMSIPAGVGPTVDDGLNCGINQDGPVWFMGGPLFENYTRTCRIPLGKKIFLPIIDVIADYPCPADPTFKPAAGQTLEAFLNALAGGLMDQVTLAQAQFDGRPVEVHRLTSKLFGFTAAADLKNSFDSCATGSPQVATSDGFFVLLPPPSRGQHVLRIQSTFGAAGHTEGTYNLIIE